jgi:hypothetical protein
MWARNFNSTINRSLQRNSVVSPSPFSWRTLAAATTVSLSKYSTFALAAEMPIGSGFAEQFRDVTPHTMSGSEESVTSDASEEGDVGAVAEAVSEMNIQSCNGGSSKTCWLGKHMFRI